MKRKLTALLLCLAVSLCALCGCGLQGLGAAPSENRQAFREFSDELFLSSVSSNPISLNYTLSQPEEYGIVPDTLTMTSPSLDALQDSLAQNENVLARLKNFSYRSLNDQEQLLYDSIAYAYRTDGLTKDALNCYEVLSPTVGIQAQLPILLAEYNFYSREYLDHYLNLLPQIYPYFEEILALEQEKSAAGTFMSDAMADAVITGIREFTAEPDQNFLLSSFASSVKEFSELTPEEAKDYIARNEEAVKAYVIPAYQMLAEGLEELKGTGKNEYGLCYLDHGKEYYEAIATAKIGTGKTIPQVKKMLETVLSDSFGVMQAAMKRSPDAAQEGMSFLYSQTEPEEILKTLESSIAKDFPSAGNVDYSVHYVHESMEEYLSPAFYLTPPLDDEGHENSIYINPGAEYTSTGLFTTLAHEGFPGHLYQNVMALRNDIDPLQLQLSPGGYSEGWATYVELYSYQWLGISEDAAAILSANQAATLCLYGLTDIGIHYEGWTPEDVGNYLSRFGITDPQIHQKVFESIAWEPGNYLQYIGGYCEFMELRSKAEKAWGEKYTPLRFHTFLMETGPAPFEVLANLIQKN